MSITTTGTDIYGPLRGLLTGRLVTPGDPSWDAARAAWTANIDQRPSAVVHAESVDDVKVTVTFARRHGLQVAPQATGHNAEPLGDLDRTILLRTDRMRRISVDAGRRTARVQAGVLWQQFTVAAARHGLAGLIGSSPDVGVIGYTVGGGLSWFGRKHGLSCNAVVSAEVVTSDGELRRIDGDHDPNLFWAIRGGGGLAVVTELELRLFPISRVHAGALFWPVERGKDVWPRWREWVDTLPEDMTTWARYMNFPPLPDIPEPLRGQDFVIVEACSLGERGEAEDLLAPMRDLGPTSDTFTTIPVTALSKVHMDPEQPVPAVAEGLMLADLPEAAVGELVRTAGAGSNSPLLSLEVRHLGGALARPSDSALGSLRGRFAVLGVGFTPDHETEERVRAHCATVRTALQPWDAGYGYLNFTNRRTSPSYFFAPGSVSRLLAVKQRYDAEDVIRSNHPLR
jgi:hypothetical protein